MTFLNPSFYLFPDINQLLKVCPRNTGSVEVSGSIPLGSTNYASGDGQYRPINAAIVDFFVCDVSKVVHLDVPRSRG